jgi:hypothetical protein
MEINPFRRHLGAPYGFPTAASIAGARSMRPTERGSLAPARAAEGSIEQLNSDQANLERGKRVG